MLISVMCPAPDTTALASITPGSAIVAKKEDFDNPAKDHVDCWFEGNLYNSYNLTSFFEKTQCACGRLVTAYPTVAVGRFHKSNLLEIAIFDVERQLFVSVVDPIRLMSWAQETLFDIIGERIDESIPYLDVVAMISLQGQYIKPCWFRLRSGQIVFVRPEAQKFFVFDPSDVQLDSELADLAQEDFKRLLGRCRYHDC